MKERSPLTFWLMMLAIEVPEPKSFLGGKGSEEGWARENNVLDVQYYGDEFQRKELYWIVW